MPKVSIIIPVYGVEQYIERCARSLFEQTLDSIEYIFVNDCTPDRSVEVLKGVVSLYPERRRHVKIIEQEENGGPANARNAGIKAAAGDFIAFCDADDWVEPDMYETLYETAVSHKADIVYCGIAMECGTFCPHLKLTINDNTSKTAILRSLLASDFTYSIFYLASCTLFSEGNISFPEGYHYGEDAYFTASLFYHADIVVSVDKEFYHYDRTRESSLVSNFNEKSREENIRIFLSLIAFFHEVGLESELRRELSWKILKYKQEYVLNIDNHQKFLSIYPESSRYIMSCPYCNWKNKILMWTLTHKMGFVTFLLVKLREKMLCRA